MSQQKTIAHHRNNCIGCGNCAMICDRYFEMNYEDGKADLLDSKVVKDDIHQRKLAIEDEEEVKAAAESCPVGVIKVR